MNKKTITILAAALIASVMCTMCPVTVSAYRDNNGNNHAKEYSTIRSFPNADYYFYSLFGPQENHLDYVITRNGMSIGTMSCYYNYETIGASYGYEKTSTPTIGYYMDGYFSTNGTYHYSTTRRRDYTWYSSSTRQVSVYGNNNAIYLGSIYY